MCAFALVCRSGLAAKQAMNRCAKGGGDGEHRQPAVCLTQKIHRVYLKRRKYRLFLQAQRDFALKSLGIHKGFQGFLT